MPCNKCHGTLFDELLPKLLRMIGNIPTEASDKVVPGYHAMTGNVRGIGIVPQCSADGSGRGIQVLCQQSVCCDLTGGYHQERVVHFEPKRCDAALAPLALRRRVGFAHDQHIGGGWDAFIIVHRPRLRLAIDSYSPYAGTKSTPLIYAKECPTYGNLAQTTPQEHVARRARSHRAPPGFFM